MLFLYRIYQIIFMIPVIVVSTILTGILTILGSWLGGDRFWGFWPARIWSRVCLAVTLVRVKLHRNPMVHKDTSYVFVANHQGAYDIWTLYGYLPHNFKWMMKQSLRKFPVIGDSCAASGQIFVDNSSPSAVKATMEHAEQTLRSGMSLMVFPEGSRTLDGHLGAFRKGAFSLALEFGLPVVPVTIDGAYDVLPRGSVLPHWGKIVVTVHDPILPPKPADNGHERSLRETAMALRDLAESSRKAIMTSLPDDDK